MARPKVKAPKRSYHLSGQDVVKIDGRNFYLGEHDSPLALARYAVLVARYQENDCSLPDDFEITELDPQVQAMFGGSLCIEPSDQTEDIITVRHVTAAFRKHVGVRYRESEKELHRTSKTCTELEEHYGDLPADKFGPRALQEHRQRWIDAGMTRKYINRLCRQVCQMFRHAVSQEIVAESVWSRLKSVEGLREGQTEAKEGEARTPVPIEYVRLTAMQLSPVIRAMIRVQVATGMRPSEVCRMRPCEIDRSKDVWIYRPQHHKTARRGKSKAVPIVGDSRDAITDYLNRDPEAYCFSPKEPYAWFLARKRAKRVTPDSCGNKLWSNKKPAPRKEPGECFDAGSYRQSIERAAKRAGVPRWVPDQIRQLTGTTIREIMGLDHAQALLGHSSAAMTQHYAKLSEQRAIEAAQAAPSLFEKIV